MLQHDQRTRTSDSSATNLFTNPTFATDTVWEKEAGWTIAAGVATGTATSSYIMQPVSLVAGTTYRVIFTITRTAGAIQFGSYDGNAAGTLRSSSGTFSETFVADAADAAGVNFGFSAGGGFSGTLDDVSIMAE